MQLVSGLHVLLLLCGLIVYRIICPCTSKGRGRITRRSFPREAFPRDDAQWYVSARCYSRAETYPCASSGGNASRGKGRCRNVSYLMFEEESISSSRRRRKRRRRRRRWWWCLYRTPTRRNGDLLCLLSVLCVCICRKRRSYVGRLVEDHSAGSRLINSNTDLSQLVILLLQLMMMMMMMMMMMTGQCDVTPALVSQQIYNDCNSNRRKNNTGWRNKNGATGHPISLQIFRKLHDRIAWKLVDFCNIICWTQSLTSCLKISSRCGAT